MALGRKRVTSPIDLAGIIGQAINSNRVCGTDQNRNRPQGLKPTQPTFPLMRTPVSELCFFA